MATLTSIDLIKAFLDGEKEGRSGSKTVPGNLCIKGEQLMHYKTPIAERYEDKIIINSTRYSMATGKIQKKLKEMVEPEKSIIVGRIPSNTKLSLKDYIKG